MHCAQHRSGCREVGKPWPPGPAPVVHWQHAPQSSQWTPPHAACDRLRRRQHAQAAPAVLVSLRPVSHHRSARMAADAARDAPARASQDHLVFLAGATSGIVEGLSIQPLELIKTRFQINQGQRLHILPTLRDIIREGGVLQLYRGGLPEIAGLIPRATAALSTLEFSQRVFRSWDANNQLRTPYGYLSGAMSGVTESVVFSPFQVIKVRLMAKEHLGRYRNTMDCLVKVVSSEGLSALFIGLTPTVCRNCIWNSIYYGTMHVIETHHMPPLDSPALEAARSFATGMAVGFTATCFNAPFDVVKSRVQSQLPGQRKYQGTVSVLTTIYREEGATALYRGFLPKALRLGIGQTIGLMVFKGCLKAFGVHQQPDPQVLEASTAVS